MGFYLPIYHSVGSAKLQCSIIFLKKSSQHLLAAIEKHWSVHLALNSRLWILNIFSSDSHTISNLLAVVVTYILDLLWITHSRSTLDFRSTHSNIRKWFYFWNNQLLLFFSQAKRFVHRIGCTKLDDSHEPNRQKKFRFQQIKIRICRRRICNNRGNFFSY